MHEYFPEHWRMGTARMKYEVQRARKKKNANGLSLHQNTIIIKKKLLVFYKIWKKFNEIQLTKKMDLNNRGKGKSKFFYGQEPPSGEFTTTECEVNYQLRYLQ